MKRRDVRWYGWKRDTPDIRDYKFTPPKLKTLPRSVDERRAWPPVYDQGQLGSCTGNAFAGALEWDRRKQKLADFVPSRLFIYYNGRDIEGTTDWDSGCELRDVMRAVNVYGAPPETLWPYDINEFTVKPPASTYNIALDTQAIEYARMEQTEASLKSCLASGFPVVFGFSVYESFESYRVAHTGTVPMPKPSEQMLGGHAVVLVGYESYPRFIVRNSWGADWGAKGYFTMPFAYVLDPDLAADFWVVKSVG